MSTVSSVNSQRTDGRFRHLMKRFRRSEESKLVLCEHHKVITVRSHKSWLLFHQCYGCSRGNVGRWRYTVHWSSVHRSSVQVHAVTNVETFPNILSWTFGGGSRFIHLCVTYCRLTQREKMRWVLNPWRTYTLTQARRGALVEYVPDTHRSCCWGQHWLNKRENIVHEQAFHV